MSVVPARVAGVKQVAMITPPARGTGEINPVILAAAAIAGVDEIYAAGGAQAVAALAYGTETIAPVIRSSGRAIFRLSGKQQVFGTVGIDGLAGPDGKQSLSRTESANRLGGRRSAGAGGARYHRHRHSVNTLARFRRTGAVEIEAWLNGRTAPTWTAPRFIRPVAQEPRRRGGDARPAEAVALANAYAPEHLNLAVRDAFAWLDKIQNSAGSSWANLRAR
jgi:histidinol dehydrogenase